LIRELSMGPSAASCRGLRISVHGRVQPASIDNPSVLKAAG
jgi:hypothetical protein